MTTQVKLDQDIIEVLPQIPYVIDQVGAALTWAKGALSEGEYNKILKTAYETAQFTKSISEPNFFKTHLVIASILSNIENVLEDKRFETFDTTSKAVEKALRGILIDPKLVEKHGCFKAVLLQLVPLAKTNQDLFAVALIGIKHDLQEIVEGMRKASVKVPITAQDYISILGYSVVMANIRLANLDLLNRTYQIYNEIVVLLNGLSY